MQCYPFIHSEDPDCAEAADKLQLVCAHDCPAQPLQWLWPEKIPLGKVTLLIGDPGTGKSLVALDIAARASRAGSWPEANDETRMTNAETSDHSSFDIRHSSFPTNPQSEIRNPQSPASPHSSFDIRHSSFPTNPQSEIRNPQSPASDHSSFDIRHSSFPTNPQSEIRNPQSPASPHSSFDIRHSSFPHPSSTILLSASDDLADTIRPRLDAAGADPRRVFVIPSIADLRDDFQQLRAAVNRAPNCRLIIIDPINAYVGPSDSHFQTVVRKVLAPLARLAAEKKIAVIAIAHLRKNEGDAIYRAAGSMGFVASARAVWSVSRDPENPSRHLLLPVKNNVGPDACGLAYTIQQTGPLAAPAILWDSTPLPAKPPRKRSAPPSAERVEARQWLRHALANAPRPASDVIEEGQQHGFLRRTLQRAFHELDGHTAKRGLHQGWWWSLADQSADTHPGDCPDFAESSEQNGTGTIRSGMVPFSEARDTPKTADIFEDVTFEHDIAAQQQFDELFTARPPLSHSIATLERLARQRRNDRGGLAGHHRGDGRAEPSQQNVPVSASADANGNTRPPPTTGHPILDAILEKFRNSSPITGPQHPSPDTS